jgi:hypothetical protein
VVADRDTVGRDAHVDLDPVGALAQGTIDRGEGVLRCGRVHGTAMSQQ